MGPRWNQFRKQRWLPPVVGGAVIALLLGGIFWMVRGELPSADSTKSLQSHQDRVSASPPTVVPHRSLDHPAHVLVDSAACAFPTPTDSPLDAPGNPYKALVSRAWLPPEFVGLTDPSQEILSPLRHPDQDGRQTTGTWTFGVQGTTGSTQPGDIRKDLEESYQ